MTRQEYIELAVRKYREALGACPRAGCGAHRWALATANLAARAGIGILRSLARMVYGRIERAKAVKAINGKGG